jgi:hypothetical protein
MSLWLADKKRENSIVAGFVYKLTESHDFCLET